MTSTLVWLAIVWLKFFFLRSRTPSSCWISSSAAREPRRNAGTVASTKSCIIIVNSATRKLTDKGRPRGGGWMGARGREGGKGCAERDQIYALVSCVSWTRHRSWRETVRGNISAAVAAEICPIAHRINDFKA